MEEKEQVNKVKTKLFFELLKILLFLLGSALAMRKLTSVQKYCLADVYCVCLYTKPMKF